MLTDFFEQYVTRYRPYKGGAWCYEDGLIYGGLEMLHKATGEDRWLKHRDRLIEPQLLPGPKLAGYALSEYNIDNVRAGNALLALHTETGDQKYLDYAGLLAEQLKSHPRTKSGVYWHKLRYPWQIWLDGLYMGAPFQIGYAQKTDQPALIEDSLTQIQVALNETYAPETRLYRHAVDEAKQQFWADPETGLSKAHWSRALGWLAMCLVDVAELVGTASFEPLRQRSSDLFERILELQAAPGLWLQVIDQPDLEGNYLETSASAMFVYALLKAQALGLIKPLQNDIFGNLKAHAIKTDENGAHRMAGICEVAGLGGFEGTYRDGSPEYYLTEAIVDNDAKGVGPFMICAAVDMMQKADQKMAATA